MQLLSADIRKQTCDKLFMTKNLNIFSDNKFQKKKSPESEQFAEYRAIVL
jgi:hypothetical protein